MAAALVVVVFAVVVLAGSPALAQDTTTPVEASSGSPSPGSSGQQDYTARTLAVIALIVALLSFLGFVYVFKQMRRQRHTVNRIQEMGDIRFISV